MKHDRYRKSTRKKSSRINVGTVIFIALFLYIIVQVFRYLNTEHIGIYEVVQQSIADDNVYNGFILREETLVKSKDAGYINYYVKEGARIAKNSIVYTLDESGNVYKLLSNEENAINLSDQDIEDVRNSIVSYESEYSDSNFEAIYDFKYNVENTIVELNNVNMLSKLDSILKEEGETSTFGVVRSSKSGIISYYSDGYESIKVDKITKELFDSSNYKKTHLKTAQLKNKDSNVYKIIPSESWQIAIQLTKKEYEELSKKETIQVRLVKEDLKTYASVKTYAKDDFYYATLSLSEYMIRYAQDRFIDVEIIEKSAQGLKIPVSSVVEKEFYQVPLDFFTVGGDQNVTGVIKKTFTDQGDIKTTFVPAIKYSEDETYGYIDTTSVKQGDLLIGPANSSKEGQEFTIQKKKKLKGVYNVNKGYCVFRIIDVIHESPEYYIIRTGTKYGLNNFDHIVINADLAMEQNIIK